MNRKHLEALGVSGEAVAIGVDCIKNAARASFFRGCNVNSFIKGLIKDPKPYLDDPHFSQFARALISVHEEPAPVPEGVKYSKWGNDFDEGSLQQMQNACRLPVSVGAALMPDAHHGYGLPVGGVLACDNAVIPFGVGVDISCRMRATVLDLDPKLVEKDQSRFRKSLEDGTQFGLGSEWKPRQNHPVMDADWNVTKTTKALKDRAWSQLGTSGTGNHFVEFGTLTLEKPDLGLKEGVYLCLLSHSGSRGPGAQICKFYTDIAKSKLPEKYKKAEWFDTNLAWLDLNTEAGQEYWLSMELMGEYATANHSVIHENVMYLCGALPLVVVENHHNHAWREKHFDREVIVHRKGATPAGKGVLGIIPGSLADPGFIVRGKGNPNSLHSSSHGAGRRMSRRAAIKTIKKDYWKQQLKQRGVTVISAGLDEMPEVYKDIRAIMAAQTDLVDIVARFDPKLVKMADDGKSED